MINYPYIYFENFLDEEQIKSVNNYLEQNIEGADKLGTDYKNSKSYNHLAKEEKHIRRYLYEHKYKPCDTSFKIPHRDMNKLKL